MLFNYELKKKELGIDLDCIKLPEDNKSDEIFAKLYPNINSKLSSILKTCDFKSFKK
jgi:hypothetical protein